MRITRWPHKERDGGKALKDTWSIYSKEILKILDPVLTQSDASQLETSMGNVIDVVSGSSLVHIGPNTPV
jgi:hypothetical protein